MTHSEQCNRCDAPQGRVVILNNREPVCGGCITQIASVADVSAFVELDAVGRVRVARVMRFYCLVYLTILWATHDS